MILCFSKRNADSRIGNLETPPRKRLRSRPDDFHSIRSVATDTDKRTPPCSVNLNALDSKFFRTCCKRLESVTRLRESCGPVCTSKPNLPILRLVAERARDHFEDAA